MTPDDCVKTEPWFYIFLSLHKHEKNDQPSSCGSPVFKLHNSSALAAETSQNDLLASAERVSETTEVRDNLITTTTRYRLENGDFLNDICIKEVPSLARSSEGTTTATHTWEITNVTGLLLFRATITASFQWYTKSPFAYVKCTNMSSATGSLNSKWTLSRWNTEYTKDYTSLGSASANGSFYVYLTEQPFTYVSSGVSISCTDTGEISFKGP